jgi:hypothetical protein
MISPALSQVAARFAAFVARAAADPRAAPELRADLRKFGKKPRTDDLVFSVGDEGALLLGGAGLDGIADEELTAACALLASRLAAYGVEELTLTPRAADADLYELVRLLAAEPPAQDPIGHFATRATAVDPRSIPRRLVARQRAPVDVAATTAVCGA